MSKVGNVLAGLAILYTAGTFFVIDHTAFFVNVGIGAGLGIGYVVARGTVRNYRQWRATLEETVAITVARDPDLIVEMHATYFGSPIVYLFAYDDEATFRFAMELEAENPDFA